MRILVEIAAGELIDKITILEIKLQNITDRDKLAHVRHEYDVLMDVYRTTIVETEKLRGLVVKLKEINAAIWQIEDDIRSRERVGDFGEAFVALARSAYRTNDIRAAAKREINKLLNSRINEEKSYAEY
jgi:Family of unknown function (DUF6165)